MKNEKYHIYTSENDNKKAVIVAWEKGARELYPIAKKLSGEGCDMDVILGFSQAENVELECEYAALSERLYVFTLDGSHGAKTDAKGAIKELLSGEDKPKRMYIACPEEMRISIANSIKGEYK